MGRVAATQLARTGSTPTVLPNEEQQLIGYCAQCLWTASVDFAPVVCQPPSTAGVFTTEPPRALIAP